MKMFILGAALMLLAPGLVTAVVLPTSEPAFGPRYGVTGETIEVFVPAGYALVATATATDFTVSAIPIEEIPSTNNHDGSASGCFNILGSGAAGWVRNGINVDDCTGGNYQAHSGSLDSVSVYVIGPGQTFADALGLSNFRYWSTVCSGPLNLGGSGLGSCTGSPFPGGFGSWDALVGSNAVIGGALYE